MTLWDRQWRHHFLIFFAKLYSVSSLLIGQLTYHHYRLPFYNFIRHSLPFLHNPVPVFVGNERLVDASDHVLATEHTFTGDNVVYLVLQHLSEGKPARGDRGQLDVGENVQLSLQIYQLLATGWRWWENKWALL